MDWNSFSDLLRNSINENIDYLKNPNCIIQSRL